MNGEARNPLTTINRSEEADAKFSSGTLFVILFPVIAVGLATVALAVAAAIAGWHREEMLLAAAGIGSALALPGVALLYRQQLDRVNAERALRNVQARVGGIVESAMDAIISIDETQHVVQFNAAAEALFNWPRGAVLGQPLEMLIPERLRGSHHADVRRFAATSTTSRGMGAQTVLYGLRSNGEEFPIEASISQHVEDGHKLFTVILRDVTRRTADAVELARGEQRMRGILDSAMDAIITVDTDQRIVLFNAAAEVVFGCPRAEAIGAPLDWLIPERFRGGHHRLVGDFGKAGVASRRMGHARVVMGLRRDGTEFPIEASISHVHEGNERFYTVILRDVTQRTADEAALRESRLELQDMSLTAHNAREQEKSRIARELHDELGQAMTALKIDVTWLRGHLQDTPADVQDKMAAMQTLLDGTVAAARRIASDLRPLMLDDLGLTAAAEWLTETFATRTGIPCSLVLGAGDLDLRDPHATVVFRVLQESLTNVAKHARATRVTATLERDSDGIVLTVVDDGLGFSTAAPRNPGSIGLLGLKERAHLVGGRVTIESTPGNGTRVELHVPDARKAIPA